MLLSENLDRPIFQVAANLLCLTKKKCLPVLIWIKAGCFPIYVNVCSRMISHWAKLLSGCAN